MACLALKIGLMFTSSTNQQNQYVIKLNYTKTTAVLRISYYIDSVSSLIFTFLIYQHFTDSPPMGRIQYGTFFFLHSEFEGCVCLWSATISALANLTPCIDLAGSICLCTWSILQVIDSRGDCSIHCQKILNSEVRKPCGDGRLARVRGLCLWDICNHFTCWCVTLNFAYVGGKVH